MQRNLKGIKKLLISCFIIACLIVVNLGVSSSFATKERIIQPNISRPEVISQLQSKGEKADVHVIGDVDVSEISGLVNKKGIKNLDEFNSNSNFKSIWVGEDKIDELLDKPEELKKMLEKGISVYFVGLKDMNILRHKFSTTKVKEESLDKLPDFQFITQNSKGDYFIGFGHFYGLSSKEKQEAMLASAWNRKNDLKYSGAMKKETVQSQLNEKLSSIISPVVYASDSDFSINYKWSGYSGGWDTFEHYSTYGDVNEWRAFYYYDDGSDHYYAIAASTYMTPNSSKNGTCRKLEIEVDCDYYQSNNEIFRYAPEIAPTSDEYEFSIGAGSNGEATIGASWKITRNDLTTDFTGTSQSDEIYKAKFVYDEGSQYANTENRQDWSVIMQGESDTSCEFRREYRGYFYGLTIFNTSDCGSSYHITLTN